MRSRSLGRPRDGVRRPFAAVALAALALLLLAPAAPADAHAVLTGASPSAGEELATAPDEVRLTFNEPVSATADALRVFDADATRIDAGPVDGVGGAELAAALPDGLPDGAYVAVYRVISADSHPVAGVVSFTVGAVEALDDDTIAAIAGPGAGTLGTVGSVLRGIGYVGTLLAAGAVIFAVVVARGPADRRRAERVGRPAALVGVVAVAVHLPVQAAATSGYGLLEVLTQGGVLGSTLTSGFGQSWLARIAALLALAVPWFVAERSATGGGAVAEGSGGVADTRAAAGSRATARPLLWLGGAAALALGSYLLDGHQRTVEPTWLLVGGDAVHLAGGAAWFGGIVLLLATLRSTRLEDDPVGAATVVARFSTLAAWSVLALSVAGTAMALPLVRGLDALTSTAYGWILLAKVGLVVVVVAVAAYNRRTLVPAIVARAVPAGASVDAAPEPARTTATAGAGDASAAWARLTRTVQLEAVLLVAVLGLTGFLVTTQPAADAAGLTGPASVDTALTDDVTLNVTVDPSEVGLNAIHVYAFDATGQLTDDVDTLRLEFTYVDEGIGPFPIEPFVAGPGHWTATIEELRFAGDWEVRVVGGLGRFDEAEVTVPFTVR